MRLPCRLPSRSRAAPRSNPRGRAAKKAARRRAARSQGGGRPAGPLRANYAVEPPRACQFAAPAPGGGPARAHRHAL